MTVSEITNPFTETPGDVLAIFVSHLWSDYSLYEELISLLNGCTLFKWKNNSIARNSHEVEFYENYKSWYDRIIRLENERLQRLNNQIDSIQKMIDQTKFFWRIRQKRFLKAKISDYKRERDSVKSQLNSFLKAKDSYRNAYIRELSWYYKEGFRYIPNYYATDNLKKRKNKGIFDDESGVIIELEIFNRIELSDVLILVASMYSQYKTWMDYELRLAHKLKVPVIAILPENQYRFPQEIRTQCENLLFWEKDKICEKLFEMATEKKRLRDDFGVFIR